MRTLFASIVTLLFFASAAQAGGCPFGGHSSDQTVEKPVVIVGT